MLNPHRLLRRQPAPLSLRYTGFTLVELVVTIAIAVLLMVVAVPGFVQFQRNAQLSDAVGNFIAAANAARSNAMKQGLNTYLVPTTGTNWRSGWMVFTDSGWNKVYDAGTDEVVVRREALATDISISTPGASGGQNSLVDGYLLFNGSGFPRLKDGNFSNGRIVISTVGRSRTVIFDQAGRVRSCVTGDAGC